MSFNLLDLTKSSEEIITEVNPISSKSYFISALEQSKEINEIYRNASDKMYFKQISGRFYFYDETIVNGRAKITATQHMIKKNPSYILGYININQ